MGVVVAAPVCVTYHVCGPAYFTLETTPTVIVLRLEFNVMKVG
jgi:hypothetical protein